MKKIHSINSFSLVTYKFCPSSGLNYMNKLKELEKYIYTYIICLLNFAMYTC